MSSVYAGLLLKIGKAPIKYFDSSFMVYLLADVHIINHVWDFNMRIVIFCAQIWYSTNYYFREGCHVASEPKSLLSSLSSGTFSALFVMASPNHCHHSHEHSLDQDQCQDGDLLQLPRRNSGQMLVCALPACRFSLLWLQPWQDSTEFLFLVKMCLSNS